MPEPASSSILPVDPTLEAESEMRRNQRLGSVLVFFVVMLYVGSSVMIQVLFDEMRYEKPFFFSYVSVSLCTVYLVHSAARSCQQHVTPPRHAYSKELQLSQAFGVTSPLLLLRPALLLAPSYFCLNYTYFFSLDLTSVSSTMILSASTGVWTLLFARLLLGELLTRLRLATVLLSLLGMCLVTTSSYHASSASEGASTFSGAVLALMSAAASGVYMVLLPVTVPDKSVHMPSLFGMIGLVCMIGALPLFPLLHVYGIERFELPPTRSAAVALLVNAATSTVLPDMLLAKAVMMTSPLVATLGLSMMIPLSVFADYARGLAHLSPPFFIGTLCVFGSYLLESWAESPEDAGDDADDEARR